MPPRTSQRPRLWVVVGLLCVLILINVHFFDANGFLERGASAWRVAAQVVAHLGLIVAWWQLKGCSRPLMVSALWALPMLFALPMHSRDAYSYAAQGWLMSRGLNPYEVTSGEANSVGLLVGRHWHDTTSVYPSLSLEIFGLVDRITGSELIPTVIGLRLTNVLAMVLLAWALARIARHLGVPREFAWWVGIANPVVLVQWVGGVHNDAIMVALIAFALSIALRPGWVPLALAGVGLGCAMGIKQSAALAGLGLVAVAWSVRHREGGWGRLALVALVPGATTVAIFVALGVASGLGVLGWNAPTAGNPVAAPSNAPLSWVASFLRYNEIAADGLVNRSVATFSYVLIAATLVALWVWIGPKANDPGRPWLFLILSLLSFGALGPAMQPWYLTWVIPFFAFARSRWWPPLIVGFALLAGLQDGLPPYVSMGVVAPVVLAIWVWNPRS